ncbi:MAG TPA: hypothetical protein DCQ06_08575 [Myxococcales bacterium]|nr:hypothetical protein [Myxococcales bacterium]
MSDIEAPQWSVQTAETWIKALLPEPVIRSELPGDVVLLQAGDPGQVVVRLKPAALRIGVFSQRWWRDRGVLVDETLIAVPWVRLPSSLVHAQAVVRSLIEAATALRRSRYFHCEVCQQQRPPELQVATSTGKRTCQTCWAEQ